MLESLITTYGYAALFVGTFLEGETILIIAAIAAFEGLLDIRVTILIAFVGSMLGDMTYFFVGRIKGEQFLRAFPRWHPRVERVLLMLDRHSVWLILTFRFMYAVRNFTSIAIGMSRTPVWHFLVLNAIGAAVWAVAFGTGGYVFGDVLIAVVKDVKSYQVQILGAVGVGVVLLGTIRWWRRRQQERAAPVAGGDV